MSRRCSCFMAFVFIALLVGCESYPFEDTYSPIPSPLAERYGVNRKEPVKLMPVKTEEDFLNIMDDGYIPIGQSSYVGPHAPLFYIKDVAEEKGADLVLLDETFKTQKNYTSVLFLPMTRTSYTYGNASFHGAYGSYGYGTYSGTTTTTDLQAIQQTNTVNIYNQTAMFLKKVDMSSLYGVLLYVPPRLPGSKVDEECPVTILSVQNGSKADLAGYRRGDRVIEINNKLIRTRKDSAHYIKNPELISSLKVETKKRETVKCDDEKSKETIK